MSAKLKIRFVLVGILALFALVVLVAGMAPASPSGVQRRREPRTVPVEYTVASSSAGTRSAGSGRVAWSGGRAALGPLSETLTLVLVGSMLIGLAAVVRRTN
jgi:hypothetical protein